MYVPIPIQLTFVLISDLAFYEFRLQSSGFHTSILILFYILLLKNSSEW